VEIRIDECSECAVKRSGAEGLAIVASAEEECVKNKER
jgi:hypothetical protein